MITDRQKRILNVIIEEYIKSAEPVSSQFLFHKYDFGICPATMRIEMKNLTDLGLLQKPYISSGRIPTDKAYRFFVNDFFKKLSIEEELKEMTRVIRSDINEFEIAAELTSILAELSSNYVILSFPKRKVSWQAGFEDIVKEPEFSDKDFIVNFLSFLEEFSKEPEKINLESKIKIFIGNENPFDRGHDFTLICSENALSEEEKVRVTLIGPKRMNYRKNINLIDSLIKIIDEKYEKRR